MVRQLAKSIREYKRASIATPLLVSCEVLMECTIPFIIAQLVNEVKSGCDMEVILGYGGILVCRGRKIFCVYGKNSSLIRNRYV